MGTTMKTKTAMPTQIQTDHIYQAKPILSRNAYSLYWLARYYERSNNLANALNHINDLDLLLPKQQRQLDWSKLLELITATEDFYNYYTQCQRIEALEFLILRQENSNSLFNLLKSARYNAQTTRHLLPAEAWAHLNYVWQSVKDQVSIDDLSSLLKQFIESYWLFNGCTEQNASPSYSYLQLGKQVERLDYVVRLMLLLSHHYAEVKPPVISSQEWSTWLNLFGIHEKNLTALTTDPSFLLRLITKNCSSYLAMPKLFNALLDPLMLLKGDLPSYLDIIQQQLSRLNTLAITKQFAHIQQIHHSSVQLALAIDAYFVIAME